MQDRTVEITAFNCPKATSVKVLSDYRLLTAFNNGIAKIFDFKPYFQYRIFDKLKDKNLFSKAYLEHGAVAWNDDLDIAIEEVYEKGVTVDNSN